MTWGWAALVAVASVPASAGGAGVLHRLADEVRAQVVVAVHAQPARPVPPEPVAVHWNAQWIGTLDLGAPLVALTAADLDGDGKAELYAVTTREVIALAAVPRVHELGRVAFGGSPAVPQPRDPVGAAIVEHSATLRVAARPGEAGTFDGSSLVASASPWAQGLRVTWQAGALRGDAGGPGFELCPGQQAIALAPGRDYFGEGPAGFYGETCATLVDAKGAPLAVHARLLISNKLEVTVGQAAREVQGVGTAFAIADFDRDGTPDLVFAGPGAPGDRDRVEVVPLGGPPGKPRLVKLFKAEGVAGIAAGDVDGDRALEAIAAVRLAGATQVDFWRLN